MPLYFSAVYELTQVIDIVTIISWKFASSGRSAQRGRLQKKFLPTPLFTLCVRLLQPPCVRGEKRDPRNGPFRFDNRFRSNNERFLSLSLPLPVLGEDQKR